jgi:Site-specific recombinase.
VSLVYVLHQLHQRIDRAEALLNCLVGDTPARDTAHLFANFVRLNAQRRSLRALWRHNTACWRKKWPNATPRQASTTSPATAANTAPCSARRWAAG